MLNTVSRSWLIGGWMAIVAVCVAISVTMGANLSTIALLLAMGLAPAVVMVLIARSASSPTVAEILHRADIKDGRP